MGANDCAFPLCRDFSMSQCSRCQLHYWQRHKALLAHLCINCQAAKQEAAPRFIFAGVVLLFLAFACSIWVHGNNPGVAPFSRTSLAPLGGILGSYVGGLAPFSYGWLHRQ